MERVVLTESIKLMELMAWKLGRNVNWFMEIMAVLKQIESMELEFSAIVTTDLTVLLEQLNYWNWTVTIELFETIELMELKELIELLEK